jgi:uncharacterized protein with PQ loop repeat
MSMQAIISWLFGTSLMVNAFIFLPQALRIHRERSARGVSTLTFGGFTLMQLVGTLHGYFQNDRVLMLGMVASMISCGSVTVLAWLHRERQPHA